MIAFDRIARRLRDEAEHLRDLAAMVAATAEAAPEGAVWAWLQADAAEETAQHWESLRESAPRDDFELSAAATVDAVPVQVLADDPAARSAVEAQRTVAACVRVYAESDARRRGAERARVGAAVRRQATTMSAVAAQAAAASRAAWQRSRRVTRQVLDRPHGGAAPRWRMGPVDDNRRQALLASGMAAEDLERLRVRMQDPGGGRAEAIVSRSWPPAPPDLIALIALTRAARTSPDEALPLARTPRVRIRPGLVDALRHRAGFTRTHRGAFAGPLDGDTHDSSGTPVGWHAGDRVFYVWHQQRRVVLAEFDARGEPIGTPAVVGRGLWPRATAHENRVGVTWHSPGGTVVRVRNGTTWGPEIELEGTQPSPAFSRDGVLHLANTEGLWRVGESDAELLERSRFTEPALAIDGAGRRRVAFRQGTSIMCDGAILGDGRRPSLLADDDGTLHVAYDGAQAVHVRRFEADRWGDALSIPHQRASWVALARGEEGVRLTFTGAAEQGPDALWLIRLPDSAPVLMPSIAPNVTDAWLMMHFALRGLRSGYRPHDVLVTLNDARVHLFRQTVPEGRYLFPVDPWKIFVSAGPTVANRVGIRSWHMNAGHYAVNSDYSLIVRTGWSERHTFARSVDEARAVVRVRGAIHGEADLVLVANAVDLPVNVPEAGPLEFALTVVNLGEARSTPARVRMLVSNRPLAETAVPALEPLAERRIVMSLPYDGEMAAVTFALEQPGRDLDPANDVLVFNLWAPRQRAYDESSPTRPAPSPEPAPVDVPLAFAPMIDFSVPSFDGDRVIYLSDYAGKVVLINWWRTTCGWSQRESEKLVALDRKHRGNGLVILGISDDTADSVDDVSTYLQQRGMTWPNALNDQGEVTREIVRGRDQTPGNYLVLRSGHYAYLGLDRSDANWRQLEASVESALAAPPPAGSPVERRKLAVAEPLSLPDLEGQTVTLANYSGRPIVVNFFNEGNCDWVGGVLSALHRDYAAAGLQLIGVGLDGDEGLRRCIAQNLIQYPVLRGDEAIRKRWLGGSQAWGVFFITREGRVFKKIVNSINSGLEQAVFTAYAKHLLRDTHA